MTIQEINSKLLHGDIVAISAKCGLSKSTVSRYLSGLKVSAKSAKAIHDKAIEFIKEKSQKGNEGVEITSVNISEKYNLINV